MRLPWPQLTLPLAAAPAGGPPTAAAQQALLDELRASLRGVLAAEGLPDGFALQPGLRLRRSFGNCRHAPGRPPVISVRCVTPEGSWRPPGAVLLTLLHEIAHLRYRGHGPRFWALHRRLLERATQAGLYLPHHDDPTEPAQGNGKLAGSPAGARAQAAREHRTQRAREGREAARAWRAGDTAVIAAARGPLAQQVVRVVKVGRTRVVAALADGRRYSVPAVLLARPSQT